MPKTKPENDAELKDLQQVNASLDKELKTLDKASEALEKEWKARRKTEPGSKKREAADRKFYDAQTVFFAQKEAIAQKYKATLKSQSPSFYGGPKSASEEDVHEWATGNYITLRLLSSQAFLSLGHGEQRDGQETVVDRENRERASAANKMPALTELGVRYLWNHKPAGMYLSGKAPTLPAGQTYEQAMARTRALAQEQYRGLFGDDEFSFKSDSLKKTREIYQAGELKKEEERKAAEQRSAALLDEVEKELDEKKQDSQSQKNEENLDKLIEALEKDDLDEEEKEADPEIEQIRKESEKQLDEAQKETDKLKSAFEARNKKFEELVSQNRGDDIPDEELYAELGVAAPEKDGKKQAPKGKEAANTSEYVRIEPFDDDDEKEDRKEDEKEIKRDAIVKDVQLPENDIPLIDEDARKIEEHKQEEKEEDKKEEKKDIDVEPDKKAEELSGNAEEKDLPDQDAAKIAGDFVDQLLDDVKTQLKAEQEGLLIPNPEKEENREAEKEEAKKDAPKKSDSEIDAEALAEEEAEQKLQAAQKEAKEKEEKKKQEEAFMALFDDPEPEEEDKKKEKKDADPEPEAERKEESKKLPKEAEAQKKASEEAPQEEKKDEKGPEEAPQEEKKDEKAPEEAPQEEKKDEKAPEEAPQEVKKDEKAPEEAPEDPGKVPEEALKEASFELKSEDKSEPFPSKRDFVRHRLGQYLDSLVKEGESIFDSGLYKDMMSKLRKAAQTGNLSELMKSVQKYVRSREGASGASGKERLKTAKAILGFVSGARSKSAEFKKAYKEYVKEEMEARKYDEVSEDDIDWDDCKDVYEALHDEVPEAKADLLQTGKDKAAEKIFDPDDESVGWEYNPFTEKFETFDRSKMTLKDEAAKRTKIQAGGKNLTKGQVQALYTMEREDFAQLERNMHLARYNSADKYLRVNSANLTAEQRTKIEQYCRKELQLISRPVQKEKEAEKKTEAVVKEAPQEEKVEPQEEKVEPQEEKVEAPQEEKVEAPQEEKAEAPQEEKAEAPQEEKVEAPQEEKVEAPQEDNAPGEGSHDGSVSKGEKVNEVKIPEKDVTIINPDALEIQVQKDEDKKKDKEEEKAEEKLREGSVKEEKQKEKKEAPGEEKKEEPIEKDEDLQKKAAEEIKKNAPAETSASRLQKQIKEQPEELQPLLNTFVEKMGGPASVNDTMIRNIRAYYDQAKSARESLQEDCQKNPGAKLDASAKAAKIYGFEVFRREIEEGSTGQREKDKAGFLSKREQTLLSGDKFLEGRNRIDQRMTEGLLIKGQQEAGFYERNILDNDRLKTISDKGLKVLGNTYRMIDIQNEQKQAEKTLAAQEKKLKQYEKSVDVQRKLIEALKKSRNNPAAQQEKPSPDEKAAAQASKNRRKSAFVHLNEKQVKKFFSDYQKYMNQKARKENALNPKEKSQNPQKDPKELQKTSASNSLG